MSDVIRGTVTNLDDFVELDRPSELKDGTEVVVLPVTEEGVGPVEMWMEREVKLLVGMMEHEGFSSISVEGMRRIATALEQVLNGGEK